MPPFSQVEVTCTQCGAKLTRHRYRTLSQERHFCNHACHNAWQREHYPRGENSPKYKSVTVQCANCGASLERPPHRVRDAARHFCNLRCGGEWLSKNQTGEDSHNWNGGRLPYYGPNWKQQRRAARKRDGYRCRHCGNSENKMRRRLDVHHIIPFRTFGYVAGENDNYKQANALDNLISLCQHCHNAAEHGHSNL